MKNFIRNLGRLLLMLVSVLFFICKRSWNGPHKFLLRGTVVATVFAGLLYISSYTYLSIRNEIESIKGELVCINEKVDMNYMQLSMDMHMADAKQIMAIQGQYDALTRMSRQINSYSLQRKIEAGRRQLESTGLVEVQALPKKGIKDIESPTRLALQQQYVNRFAKIAQIEMEKYGIPASITLAQGILESQYGKSELAAKHNNHFGIKCFNKAHKKDSDGHCVNYADDNKHDMFRTYTSAWESFRAHSQFLMRDNYAKCRKLSRTDYKGWAKGLKKAGYATSKTYDKKLIQIIESLNLHRYDYA